MITSGLRARVQRLLSGDCRTDDLTRLFLYVRDRCDGRHSVREIGDFIAHRDERVKGVVTTETRDWFTTARFYAAHTCTGKSIDFSNLPAEFPNVLNASCRRLSALQISAFGPQRANIRQRVRHIVDKLVGNQDGTWSISDKAHNNTDLEIVKCLCNLTVSPAFDNERLFADFSATLRSHALLKKNESGHFLSIKPAVGLFAVSQMHNSKIRVDDRNTVNLKATHAEGIEVSAPVGVADLIPVMGASSINSVTMSSAIFKTNLTADEYCEPELAHSSTWDFDVELTPNIMLGRLG